MDNPFMTKTVYTLDIAGVDKLTRAHLRKYGDSARLPRLAHGGVMLAYDQEQTYVEIIPQRVVLGEEELKYKAVSFKFEKMVDFVDFILDYLPDLAPYKATNYAMN